MRTNSSHRPQERGQVIVIFALAAVVLIAMVGLVLDGGAAFAHRRDAQNAADLAALFGANAYLSVIDQAEDVATAFAIERAWATATDNGFTDGAGGTTVTPASTRRTARA